MGTLPMDLAKFYAAELVSASILYVIIMLADCVVCS